MVNVSENLNLALKLIALNRIVKKVKRKPRNCCIRNLFLRRNEQRTDIIQDLSNHSFYHQKFFRMTKESFNELSMVKDDFTVNKTHICPISPLQKLALTLRFLASGDSQISLAFKFRISPSSISLILRETISAICRRLQPNYLPSPQKQNWIDKEKKFSTKWNFPNAVGAMDGKHVRIKAPPKSGSKYFNYKGYFSIVLFAVADPDYKFTVADVGMAGSISDGGVLSRSKFGKKLNNLELDLPEPKLVGETYLPMVFLGDKAFPLKQNIMKPHPGSFWSKKKGFSTIDCLEQEWSLRMPLVF